MARNKTGGHSSPRPRPRRAALRSALGAALPLFVLLVLLQPSLATAAPAQGVPLGAGLADRDANGISDGLQAKLDQGEASARFEVVLTFTPVGSLAAAQAAVGRFEVRQRFGIIRGAAATMTAGQIRALGGRPGVFRIEEDVEVRALLAAARPDFGVELATSTYGVNGAGVDICVIDTGLDAAHEQLDGGKVVGWKDFVNNRSSPYDDQGHGTHVASIAAGDGTGGSIAAMFKGVAPGANVWGAKVLDANGSGTLTAIVNGIDWCAAQPAVDILSMSLGTVDPSDGNDSLSQAVNNAVTQRGKIVVAAAGNSGDAPETIVSPGAALHAITVGSVAEHSAPPGAQWHSDGILLDWFSSRGPTLSGLTKPDIVSPGDSIGAAAAGTGSAYAVMSGTSMATPFVSGAVALALDAANSSLGAATVKSALESTAEDWGPSGKDNDWGAGVIDVAAFVGQAAGLGATQTSFPSHTRVTGSVPNRGLWSYQFSLSAGELSAPIAATILLDGQLVCVWDLGPWGCFAWEWSPDMDARLLDPNGQVLAESTCAAGAECTVGRQETLHAMPTVAGTYTIQVYPWADGDGKGGSFAVDLSRGPVGSAAPPPSPTVAGAPSLSATAGDGVVTLSWTEPSSGGSSISEYLIFRGTSSGGETLLTSVPVTQTSYMDTAITNGTTYYYQVSAVNSVGEGARSNEVSAAPQANSDSTPPAAPTNLSADPGNTKVWLDWDGNNTEPDFAGYHVYRSTDPPSAASRSWTKVTATPLTDTTYKDSGLANGTTYHYVVKAADATGNESPSNEASATANVQFVGFSPSSAAAITGSFKGDPLSTLESSDDAWFRVSSAKVNKKHWTDWYGEFVVSHPADTFELWVEFEGHHSRSVSQKLYVYNWSSGGWDQVDSRNVGTSDIRVSLLTSAPGPYVGAGGTVRFRVAASSNGSFTSFGDRLRVATKY